MIVTNEDLLEELHREQQRINNAINQVNELMRNGSKYTTAARTAMVAELKAQVPALASDYKGTTRPVVKAEPQS